MRMHSYSATHELPDNPSLSMPGRGVILIAWRLTLGMAEITFAMFGQERLQLHLPAAPVDEVLPTICPRLLGVVELAIDTSDC